MEKSNFSFFISSEWGNILKSVKRYSVFKQKSWCDNYKKIYCMFLDFQVLPYAYILLYIYWISGSFFRFYWQLVLCNVILFVKLSKRLWDTFCESIIYRLIQRYMHKSRWMIANISVSTHFILLYMSILAHAFKDLKKVSPV